MKYKLSASSASRVVKCPASFHLENTITPELKYNAFANAASLGSSIHAAAETILFAIAENKKPVAVKASLKAQGILDTSPDYDKAFNAVDYYTKYVKKLWKKRGGELLIEQKSRVTSNGVDCVFKADAMIVTSGGVDIIDLKTGNFHYGESATEQLTLSALIYLDNPKTLRGHVVQPNYYNEAERVFTFSKLIETPAKDLDKMTRNLLLSENDFRPGGHCAFCPGIVTCKFAHKYTELVAGLLAASAGDMEGLTREKLEAVWLLKKPLESFLAAVEQRLTALIDSGVAFENVQKVTSYGHRRWVDLGLVNEKLSFLGEKLFKPREIITPAQAEKLAGKVNISELYSKPELYKLAEKDKSGDVFEVL